ncbi:MAG: adenylate/guanylate cyclase domain-containing protein, partial [Elusimicrobiota bacterium]
METRNIAIMLTDIKGFTSKTASFSRAETQELLSKHRELVLPVTEKFHGRLVKTIGDAFLVAFNSPTDAVICGVEIQDVLKNYNVDKVQSGKIEIRIAINSGEVAIHDDGDIYGDAVNITARLESIAEAGEVFFTEAVYLSMNKKEVPSSEIGYRQFKGIPDKIKVFRVLREV